MYRKQHCYIKGAEGYRKAAVVGNFDAESKAKVT